MNANAKRKPPTPLGWHDADSAAAKLSAYSKSKVTKQELLRVMRENGWLKNDPIGGVHDGNHNLPTAELQGTQLLRTQDRMYNPKGHETILRPYKVVLIHYKALVPLQSMLKGEKVNLAELSKINTKKTLCPRKRTSSTKRACAARDQFLAEIGL